MITIHERMSQQQIVGLSLAYIEDGVIQKTECFGELEVGTSKEINEETIFNACSISKLLTSILVLKLVEGGLLDLDENINDKLVSWKMPDNDYTHVKKVTLRHLLSHQSGIVDPDNSFSPLFSFAQWPSMNDLLQGTTPYCPTPIKSSFEPGLEFHYSDAGFCIVQLLVEEATNTSFPSLMTDIIFQPLAMTNSFFSSKLPTVNTACGHNKDGTLTPQKYPLYPYPAACGIWTTPSDLAKLLIEVMQALKGKSKLGLTSIHELIHPQGCKEWMGLGVFLDGTSKKLEMSSLGWGVGYQCMLVAYPYLEKGFVVMSNTDTGVHQMQGFIGDIYRSFVNQINYA
ncbi:serine hydrolase domain-containing protein [Lysinibacillus cavernae]|uniref:serine hydrolase domain-containing protein n=1 Tax=Lysinibacillus cavernae TaxID=2666135 RepID=UPI0018C33E31|nr:serine hydrolase domain-containing protein [Lysinibacillus cavernae]